MKVRVSSISWFNTCPKRAKIMILNNPQPIKGTSESRAVEEGIRLHEQYEYMLYNLSFDRELVRYKLGIPYRIFEKKINVEGEEHVIRGKPDDLRVIFIKENNIMKKYTMLIEVKTTNRKKCILNPGITQLQIYMWLMKEELEKIGYPLWKRGLLEIYSQKNGELIKRVSVPYNEQIENFIRKAILSIYGLHPMKTPSYKICKYCPKNIKEKCEWYTMMKE